MQRALIHCLSCVLFVATVLDHAAAADWPMFRADASRSGYTSEKIPNRLELAWEFRSPHRPRPAWPTSERIQFDRAFQPIVMGERIIFGSSADDKVYALDARSGHVLWEFFTGSPVRLAPAGWKDRAFVASDDGWLYALALEDGRVLWKHRGGPTAEMVIGNERMTSKWPVRGGPVVLDDVVYFAAGVWPSDGVYLHALHADSGQPVWANDETGQLFMAQPHGGAEAESGVSAQGYLVVDEDQVIVPTGRAVPAVFDRANGKLLYYHLQKNQQRGGSRVMVTDRYLFNSGCRFDRKSGALSSRIGDGVLVAIPKGILRANGRSLVRYRWETSESLDRKGKPITVHKMVEDRLISMDREILEFIVAGADAICGENGRVSAIDYAGQRTIWWSHEVDGRVLGLSVANGRVIVSTDRGVIYCFDGEPAAPGSREVASDRSAANPASTKTVAVDFAKAAREILSRTKLNEGFCVDLGAGEGDLALELARQSDLHIYALEPDPKRAAIARRKIDAAGLYGVRVTVHQARPEAAPYPEYFANLVVSSVSLSGDSDEAIDKEAHRLQRPFGGKICQGAPGSMQVETRGGLTGSGSWTHQNSNPANTLCSDDSLIKGPLSMFWFRDVEFEVPNRHGQGPAPLYHEGFMVIGGVDGLCCLDAYNGRRLWTYPLKGLLADYDGIHHDVGIGETSGVFCLGDGAVFVRQRDRCYRIALATGKLLGEFKTPAAAEDVDRDWGYLAYSDGVLFGSVANRAHAVSPRYKLSGLRTESVLFFAMDPKTGRVKWSYAPRGSIRHNAIAIADARVYLIDRPLIPEDHVANPRRNGKHVAKLTQDKIPSGTLVAFSAASGAEIWRHETKVFGTQLSVSEEHSVLLMNYQAVRHGFFALPSEIGNRLAAFDIESGRPLWDREAKYRSRPLINGDTIYAQGGAWNLKSGEPVSFDLGRSYGCGQISASKYLMLFRSATLGYLDLTRGSGTENYGGIRPGCWINAIPAGGIVLVPDGSSKCRCSYQMKAWFALQERK
jgi:outer membrane protein assembly factor BamB